MMLYYFNSLNAYSLNDLETSTFTQDTIYLNNLIKSGNKIIVDKL